MSDEIAEVGYERLHVNLPVGCQVIEKTSIGIFGKVVPLQSIKKRLERLHDAVLVNWVGNFAHTVSPLLHDAVGRQFADELVANVEGNPSLIRAGPHQDSLKSFVPTDIGRIVSSSEMSISSIKICANRLTRSAIAAVRGRT